MVRIVLVVGQIKFEDKVRDDEIIIIVIKKYIKKNTNHNNNRDLIKCIILI